MTSPLKTPTLAVIVSIALLCSVLSGMASAQTMIRSAVGPIYQAGGQPPAIPFNGPSYRSANYLEPFDRSIQPGECRLDGLLVTPTSGNGAQVQMRVLWVTMPGRRRTVLPAPRLKTVEISSATSIQTHRLTSGDIDSLQSANQPIHIEAIGPATAAGAPLSARMVVIAPADSYEIAVASDMQAAARAVDPPAQVSLRQATVDVDGTSETVSYVRAEAGTYRIAAGIAHGQVGATDSLDAIARDHGAVAAINGSFFDCYDPGPLKMPDHALISGGRLVARGDIGTLIGQTPDGAIRMDAAYNAVRWHEHDPVQWDSPLPPGAPDAMSFWARAVEAVGCGPRLVTNNAVSLAPYLEGFSSGEMLEGVSVRSAIGITQNGSLVMIVTHASLPQLAKIMLQLGCRDAMNLDGGSSSGLWLRGQSIRTPGRLLSNAILVLGR